MRSGGVLQQTGQPVQLLSACCRMQHIRVWEAALVPVPGTRIPSTLIIGQARILQGLDDPLSSQHMQDAAPGFADID